MLNGNHEEIDHEFTVDGKQYNMLFYLVDGIYPSLLQFLGPETDPVTKLDGNFRVHQEGSQKM